MIIYVVYKNAGRPVYSHDRKTIMLTNKELLRTVHNAQPFTCNTHDNVRLSGCIVHRPHAKRVILLCHGYSRSKEFMLPVVEMFPNDTIALFDFRAHGESEGTMISFSVHESADVHAAVQYIKSHPDLCDLPLYGLGVSMGAASLIKAAHEGAPFKALVIDSSFAELSLQLRRSWKHKTWLPQALSPVTFLIHEWLVGASFKNISLVKMISSVAMPIYFIHADKDWFIPVDDAYALYSAAQACKRLWIVPSTQHARNFTENPKEYKQRVDEFFESVTL